MDRERFMVKIPFVFISSPMSQMYFFSFQPDVDTSVYTPYSQLSSASMFGLPLLRGHEEGKRRNRERERKKSIFAYVRILQGEGLARSLTRWRKCRQPWKDGYHVADKQRTMTPDEKEREEKKKVIFRVGNVNNLQFIHNTKQKGDRGSRKNSK